MITIRSAAALQRQIVAATSRVWAVNMQGSYGEPLERRAVERFADEGELDQEYLATMRAGWLDPVRALVDRDVEMLRIHVTDEQPTASQKFTLATLGHAVRAGETIRTLPRAAARRVGLREGVQRDDFWLIDAGVAIVSFRPHTYEFRNAVLTDIAPRIRVLEDLFERAWTHPEAAVVTPEPSKRELPLAASHLRPGEGGHGCD